MNRALELLDSHFHFRYGLFKISFRKTTIPLNLVLKLMKEAMKLAYEAGRLEGKEGKFSGVMNGYSNFNEWFKNFINHTLTL